MSITSNDENFLKSVWNMSLVWSNSSEGQSIDKWQNLMNFVGKKLQEELGDSSSISNDIFTNMAKSTSGISTKASINTSDDYDENEQFDDEVTREEALQAVDKAVEYLNENYSDEGEFMIDTTNKREDRARVIRKSDGETLYHTYIALKSFNHTTTKNDKKVSDKTIVDKKKIDKKTYYIVKYFNAAKKLVQSLKVERMYPGDVIKVGSAKTGSIKPVPAKRCNIITDYDEAIKEFTSDGLKHLRPPPKKGNLVAKKTGKRSRDECLIEEDEDVEEDEEESPTKMSKTEASSEEDVEDVPVDENDDE